ncbi:glycosyltransferase [Fictibacillus enclensis]|uniref:glycosyltransferase family protein n=1 Tax=Fictibacillus enclensis TaxID=1017270 RepID=UPI0025A15562|nr:glycosyltransferase [Fictibacillus enclensis]MDM5340605.1 glycosyltransferase [Fictibacillus enclensis]
MTEKLKILILVKEFWRNLPKHKPKFDMITAIENYADIRFWHSNGNIFDIIKKLDFIPDFILHYDIANHYGLSPNITGLGQTNIPKGCIVIDSHNNPAKRKQYFKDNKIDLIFSVTKEHFLKTHPEYKGKFRWFPFSINPSMFKDWELDKEIDYLLVGQLYDQMHKTLNNTNTRKGQYPFREEVLNRMRGVKGFVHHPHPGHMAPSNAFLNEKYANELNRSKIFFTCGSVYKYPVLKYFEAPACRTLLLAEPNQDILDLGFEDGVNFVACNRTNFYEKAIYYLEHEEERRRITDNGYQFIHTYHTNDVRARNIVNEIEEFLATRLNK